ncbi:protein of unknown function [Hyphomicrobium sp. MC1]|nr:protein of unknown function [Hyphomicrobium sp. MC1]
MALSMVNRVLKWESQQSPPRLLAFRFFRQACPPAGRRAIPSGSLFWIGTSDGRRRKADRNRRFDLGAFAATRSDRLERAAGMHLAIGQRGNLRFAAEMEIGRLRIADRPAAAALAQRLNGFALGDRNLDLLCRRHVSFGVYIERAHGRIADLRKARFVDGPFHIRQAGARAVRLHPRGGGAAGKAQAMDFADDSVARYAAEASGDLAGAQSFRPESF